MKFVPVREFRSHPKQVWKELASNYELIVTSNGKPIGLLTRVDEDNLEETIAAYRQGRALLALEQIQRESVQKGNNTISMKTIDDEIKKARETSAQ